MKTNLSTDGNGNFIIGKKTGISVFVLIAILAGTGFIFGKFDDISHASSQDLDKEVERIEKKLEDKVDKEYYMDTIGVMRNQMDRIEVKIDKALGDR